MKWGIALAALVAATLTAFGLARASGPRAAAASSHREAPVIADDPAADNTDLYAFVSPDRPDTVTLVANYIPLEEPAGGPNFAKFDDSVLYELQGRQRRRRGRRTSATSSVSRPRSRTGIRSSTTPARSRRSTTRT